MQGKVAASPSDAAKDLDAEKAKPMMRNKPVNRLQSRRNLVSLKFAVFACISVAAAVVGYGAYDVIRSYEYSQFEQEYDVLMQYLIPAVPQVPIHHAILTNTCTNVLEILEAAMATRTAAVLLGDLHPNATAWPNVAYNKFPLLGNNLLSITSAQGMHVTPIVRPDQVPDFEDFAYSFYAQHPELYAADVATSDFGRGIWSYSTDSPYADLRIHDTGAADTFLTPILQDAMSSTTGAAVNAFLMQNIRANDADMKISQDYVLACAAHREHFNETCAVLKPIPTDNADGCTPTADIVEPIFAGSDPHEVVGFLTTTIDFMDLLQDKLLPATSDVVLVIEMDGASLTYKIKKGEVIFMGPGDHHEPYGDKYMRVAQLVPIVDGATHSLSNQFDLVFYPERDFQMHHQSNFRWIFCFGAVMIIMFVSIVFATYDFAMVRENSEQQAVLDTKRQFVRFISHEVRTPLNAVSMASDLLRDQVVHAIRHMQKGDWITGSDGHSSLEESLELCEEIIGNTRSAVEVLDDLLNYDKIEVGALMLDPSFVAMDYVLEMVVKPFRGPAKLKNVSIVLDTTGYVVRALFKSTLFNGQYASLRVLGDKVRLQQVIRNLISNALKFTPASGTITVKLEWIDGGLPNASFAPEIQKLVQAPSVPLGASASPSASHDDNDVPANIPGHVVFCEGAIPTAEASPRWTEGASDREARSRTNSDMPADLGNPLIGARKVVCGSYTRAPAKPSTCHRWGSVRLSVRDSGAGLTASQLRTICSEGVQFNANALQAGQGSGLGLFIAKGIVQQHGGTMTVESEGLRKGTTFTVEFPVFACDLFSPWENRVLSQSRVQNAGTRASLDASTLAPTLEELADVSDQASRSSAPSAHDMLFTPLKVSGGANAEQSLPLTQAQASVRKVLVVDDAASNLKMMTRMLMRGGVRECIQATNGQEAVEAFLKARDAAVALEAQTMELQCIEEGGAENDLSLQPTQRGSVPHVEPFDAILMDFEMPVMNGPTATAKLRALGCTAPIIGITGNVLPADVQLFKDHGATAVLPKPFKFADLEVVWGEQD